MAIDITYNGNSIASLEGGKTAIIKCAGKKMKTDLMVIAPESSGSVSVTGLRKFNDTINTDGVTLQVLTSEDEYNTAMETMQTPPTNACVCDITLLTGASATDCQLWCFYFQYETDVGFYVWLNIDGNPTPPFGSANGEVALNFLSGAIINIKDAGQYAEWLLANTTEVGGNGMPVEIATEEQMNHMTDWAAVVGAVYKYTGETTDTYENGALYVVEESE